MTQREFTRLALNDRARAIMRQGCLITTLEYYNYQYYLYAMESYFVEVKLTAITSDVESIHIAEKYDLEKFINYIELPTLL